jgi:hypothetical protein
MHHNNLIYWLLPLVCLLGACTVAPPQVELFAVDGAEVEWPTPGNTPIGTHQLGDTVEIRIKVKDNRGLDDVQLYATMGETEPLSRIWLFEANFSYIPAVRTGDLTVRIVMRPDSVYDDTRTGFNENEPNWVEGIYGLRTDTLQEIQLEIWDYQGGITSEAYRFVVKS